jgi:hypothetical protein
MGKYMHRIRFYWPIGEKSSPVTESKRLWEREVGEFDVFNSRGAPIMTKQLAKNEEHYN